MKKKNIIIAVVAVVATLALVLGILVITHKIGPKPKEPVTTTKAPMSTTTTQAPTTTTTTEAETTAPTTTTKPTSQTPTTTPSLTAAPVPPTPTPAEQEQPKQQPETKPSNSYTFVDDDMLNTVNSERAKVGKPPLVLNTKLNEAARTRAKEIVTLFSHTRPNGKGDFSTAINAAGVTWTSCGENIAKGQANVYEVMLGQYGWMNSSGHRANILSEKHEYNAMGYAWYTYDGVNYWVQEFAYIP